MSEVKVNKVSPRTGTELELGDSGDTIKIQHGQLKWGRHQELAKRMLITILVCPLLVCFLAAEVTTVVNTSDLDHPQFP